MKTATSIKWTDVTWNPVLHEDRLTAPLRWRAPKRVFVNSLSDLFREEVPDSFILEVFAVMATAHWHTFQILTKRPERMREWCTRHRVASEPKANIWLGVSVEDQATSDKRIPVLLDTPSAVRFVSVEPLLGPVDLAFSAFNGADSFGRMEGLHWVIVSGESGPKARPCRLAWIRAIIQQCERAGVRCFVTGQRLRGRDWPDSARRAS